MSQPKIWVLIDDKNGHNIQSIAVAEAMGIEYETKKIEYNNFAKLPNNLKPKPFSTIKKSNLLLHEPWPDLVIATGRKLAPISLEIKKRSRGKVKSVQMMYPKGVDLSKFNLVATPKHDNISGENILQTIGAPHNITIERIKQEAQKWLADGNKIKDPVFTLLVGGDSKKGRFTADMAIELAQEVSKLVRKNNGTLLVTTSRRTSNRAAQSLRYALDCDYKFYNANQNIHNPYRAYLGLADVIIVTGDSVSMATEACSLDKDVYIYSKPALVTAKYIKLHNLLYQAKYAKPFSELNNWKKDNKESTESPLNEAHKIAKLVKDLL